MQAKWIELYVLNSHTSTRQSNKSYFKISDHNGKSLFSYKFYFTVMKKILNTMVVGEKFTDMRMFVFCLFVFYAGLCFDGVSH